MIRVITLVALFIFTSAQDLTLHNSTDSVTIIRENHVEEKFVDSTGRLTCSNPHLFIYNDSSHLNYQLTSQSLIIVAVTGKYYPIQTNITCDHASCVASISNNCYGNGQMNLISVEVDGLPDVQYMVNCAPDTFYKPFQWGLFLLICFCTVGMAASALYSQTWAYEGFGINISFTILAVFNTLVIVGSVLAYFFPFMVEWGLKIVGSVAGIAGVMVCVADGLWLLQSRDLKTVLWWKCRLLDMVSFMIGVICIVLYWWTDGIWIINDILAVCTIVAGIKIFKVRSLKVGIIMLVSLLLIEIAAGLIVHYVIGVSYNNLVINLFESPMVVVLPSITPEFHRSCAWLPVTNLIFPGLFISYLRRFDKARGTFMYLLVGYVSFYLGSVAWIFMDMLTVHALPLAILSDPITILGVLVVANRRNEIKTIMGGFFYDPEMPDISEELLPEREGRGYTISIQQMTQDLKIDRKSDSQQI